MASIYHLLKNQIPAHVYEQYPTFCKFIEYYYRWLQTVGFNSLEKITNIDNMTCAISIDNVITKLDETPLLGSEQYNKFIQQLVGYTLESKNGAIAEVVGFKKDLVILRYLTADAKFDREDLVFVKQNSSTPYSLDYTNHHDRFTVSETYNLPNAFIKHFINLLDADNIFGENNENIALLLKHSKTIYQAKGSEQALLYVLKALRGVDAEIRYPWKEVLKASDGKWHKQFTITIELDKAFYGNIDTNFKTVYLETESRDLTSVQMEYVAHDITKIEIFAAENENYIEGQQLPTTFGYWLKDNNNPPTGQLDYDRLKFNEDGSIVFPSNGDENGYPHTYGEYSFRKINRYLRLYFDHDPKCTLNQKCKVIGYTDKGEQFVQLQGVVTETPSSFKIISPGRRWQVGQVFTCDRKSLWEVYSTPEMPVDEDGFIKSNLVTINQHMIPVQYVVDSPLIGRVTSVNDLGEIQGIEIIQMGDHISRGAQKQIIEISPLFIDSKFQKQDNCYVQLQYGVQNSIAGYFEDSSGMLSSNDIRLQDSLYYQQFSYTILANEDPQKYIDLARLFHPAGTRMFATYLLEADMEVDDHYAIEQEGVHSHISLFDVAVAIDQLVKFVDKPLKDQVEVEDYVATILTKTIKDQVEVNDGQNDLLYVSCLNVGYDSSDPNLSYFEREFDQQGTNIGYANIGSNIKISINKYN